MGERSKAWKARRKKIILALWQGCCAYCGKRADTFDHIIPRAAGGGTGYENVVPACRPCNRLKGARPLEEFLPDAQQREHILQMLVLHVGMKASQVAGAE